MRTLACLLVLLVLLGGCSLYFDTASTEHTSSGGTPPSPDACGETPDAHVCPALGTYAVIESPVDGANAVPTPTQIKWRTFIPNTLDGRGIYLSDENGAVVDLSHWNSSCAGQQGDWVISCYDLEPGHWYTWHIWITCYDASGPHEIETSTFRVASP
jgi:hypothetical protein